MKSFGKIFLSVGLAAFIISNHASGNTHFVTQNGGNGAMSAAEFNALTGDHSGDTFFFSGNFTTRITVRINGSSSGHVTLDGLRNGTCNPTAAVDLSLCSGAANLQNGIVFGETNKGTDYVIFQDFNMDGAYSSSVWPYMVQLRLGKGGNNVFRRTTLVNAPQGFMHLFGDRFWAGGDHSPNFIMEDNKFYGKHRKSIGVQSISIHSLRNSIIRRNIIGGDRNQVPWTDANLGELIELYCNRQLLMEYNQIFNSARQSLIRPKEGGLQQHLIIRYNNLWGAAWHGISSYAGPQRDHYFYGNRIANIDTLAINIMSSTHDHHVWANLIYDAGHRGADFRPQSTYGNPEGIHFSNNTVVHNGFDPWTDRQGIQANNVNKHMRMFNNIVAYNDTSRTHPKNVVSGTGSHHTSGYNIVYSGDRTLMWATGSTGDADKNLADMQALGKETNTIVADPLLANIGSVPTQKRVNVYKDLRLTASSPAINSGQDLSSYPSFSVNLSGGDEWFESYTGYGTITFSYDDGLHPNTDWKTPIPTVVPAKFSQHGSGWERGAYVFADKVTHLNSPNNVRILNHF